ncbi:hypothetical protein FB45DRAFT_1041775 [Roridomyces roridus]|uniref:Uncharacterized protein n=1 Tax=Roridomyces roridus TaxID=1738132 RepID=A0AAD7F8Z2_9AGAR|nr:hypothetical protein FB45DRAFT_1041775 [Roridomyces roridus]
MRISIAMLLADDEPASSFSMAELNADRSPLLPISNYYSEPRHHSHEEASISSLIDGTNALGPSLDVPSTWESPPSYLIDVSSTMQICMPPPPRMAVYSFDSDLPPFSTISPFLACPPIPSSTPSRDVALTTLTSWKPELACTEWVAKIAGGLSVEDMQCYAAGVKDRLLAALQSQKQFSRECDAAFLETRWMHDWASCVHLPRPLSPEKVSRDAILELERQCEWVKCRM